MGKGIGGFVSGLFGSENDAKSKGRQVNSLELQLRRLGRRAPKIRRSSTRSKATRRRTARRRRREGQHRLQPGAGGPYARDAGAAAADVAREHHAAARDWRRADHRADAGRSPDAAGAGDAGIAGGQRFLAAQADSRRRSGTRRSTRRTWPATSAARRRSTPRASGATTRTRRPGCGATFAAATSPAKGRRQVRRRRRRSSARAEPVQRGLARYAERAQRRAAALV